MTGISTPAFELYCADGPESNWVVTQLTIEEELNRPYNATIEAWSEIDDHDGFLGANCELVFIREVERRRLYGIMSEVEFLGLHEHRFGVRLKLEPALALLDMGQHSCIWQHTSVQDIVTEVLAAELEPYGRLFSWPELQRGGRIREYCTRFRESSFEYVARLLAEEGIGFRFEHDGQVGHESIVLHDGAGGPKLENVDGSSEVPLIRDRPESAQVESVQTLTSIQRLTETASLRRDFDWLQPLALLTAESNGADARGRARRRYDHGLRRFSTNDLVERAEDVREHGVQVAEVMRGTSNVMTFAPGYSFRLSPGEGTEMPGEYVITRVHHRGARGIDAEYRNDFECVRNDIALRPPCDSRPCIRGPLTAIVVGEEEIHTDEHGRIQVQFAWEEAPSHASESSCWIRCMQNWAGPGWGAQFIPRRGMEVIVEFVDGNPDRPLVTGCTYNGNNSYPFDPVVDKTQSGWRTCSVPGGGGFNMIRFEDSAQNEEIYIHGQKDWSVVIENDKRQEIRHDETLLIAHDRSRTIGHDEQGSIGHDRIISVGGTHTEKVGVDQVISIGHDLSSTVGNTQAESVGNDQLSSIGHDRSTTIGNNHTENVGADQVISVAINRTLSVGMVSMENIGAAKLVNVGAAHALTVGAAHAVTVGAAMAVTVGAAAVTTVGGTMTTSAGKDLSFSAKKNGLIDIGDEFVLRCGDASITLKKSGEIQFAGTDISIKADGDLVMRASKISEN